MSVLNLTYRGGTFCPVRRPAEGLASALGDAARDLPKGAPVVILLHGFRYDPTVPRADPHTKLYATQADPKLPKRQMSWLCALGFRGLPSDPGLCIALGWPARGTLSDAYDRAGQVGLELAKLISAIAALLPGHPIKLMGHSLGARVALCCLAGMNAPYVAQALLLAPAEFTEVADRVLANPAARKTEILQISPVENWLFDALFVRSLSRTRRGSALGQSAPEAPNWVSLSLDTDGELDHLAALGHQVSPRKTRVCHWSSYLRGGMMEFYAALLTGERPLAQTLGRPERLPRVAIAD